MRVEKGEENRREKKRKKGEKTGVRGSGGGWGRGHRGGIEIEKKQEEEEKKGEGRKEGGRRGKLITRVKREQQGAQEQISSMRRKMTTGLGLDLEAVSAPHSLHNGCTLVHKYHFANWPSTQTLPLPFPSLPYSTLM
jgi:hypothetical protein